MKNHDFPRQPLAWPLPAHRGAQRITSPPGALHLVRPCELQNLREALSRGRVPPDFQLKLVRLTGDDLLHGYIERNSRLFLALLLAAQDGAFPHANTAELDQLLRVLAYVRKDDDAIPDYQRNGYLDDHQEVRAAARTLEQLLTRFKLWRLRHEVPRQWQRSQTQSAHR